MILKKSRATIYPYARCFSHRGNSRVWGYYYCNVLIDDNYLPLTDRELLPDNWSYS